MLISRAAVNLVFAGRGFVLRRRGVLVLVAAKGEQEGSFLLPRSFLFGCKARSEGRERKKKKIGLSPFSYAFVTCSHVHL